MRNISFNTTEDEFKDFFEAFGKVISAKLVKTKEGETVVAKGTGFV